MAGSVIFRFAIPISNHPSKTSVPPAPQLVPTVIR